MFDTEHKCGQSLVPKAELMAALAAAGLKPRVWGNSDRNGEVETDLVRGWWTVEDHGYVKDLKTRANCWNNPKWVIDYDVPMLRHGDLRCFMDALTRTDFPIREGD